MTSIGTEYQTEAVVAEQGSFCARHPAVETYLRCSRCERLMCPKCLAYTFVGTVCTACARLRRPPMYQVSPAVAGRALAAALVAGGGIGGLLALAFPFGAGNLIGPYAIFLSLFFGPPAGYAFAELLGRVARRKRGRVMQVIAVTGLLAVYAGELLVFGVRDGFYPELALMDVFALVFLVTAAVAAAARPR